MSMFSKAPFTIMSEKVRVSFAGSDALSDGFYDAEEGVIGISYITNPDFYYEHSPCSYEDFEELLQYMKSYDSAGRGYKAWKKIRKDQFRAADRARFDELWDGLNDYQRKNFVEWFAEKARKHGTRWATPINRRRTTLG